jgi:hypothetical protein
MGVRDPSCENGLWAAVGTTTHIRAFNGEARAKKDTIGEECLCICHPAVGDMNLIHFASATQMGHEFR